MKRLNSLFLLFLFFSSCSKSNDSVAVDPFPGTYINNDANFCADQSKALILTISSNNTLTLAETQFTQPNCTGDKSIVTTSPETSYVVSYSNAGNMVLEVFTQDKIYWAVKLTVNGFKQTSSKTYDEAKAFLDQDWSSEKVASYSRF